jgi:hypothetical protein
VFIPLRLLCTKVIKKPDSILDLHEEILDIMDLVAKCVSPIENADLEVLKANVIKVEEIADCQDHEDNPQGEYGRRKTLFDERMLAQETERQKLPNSSIVKFFFENDILDMLVFLTLKFYTAIKEQLSDEKDILEAIDSLGYKYTKKKGKPKRLIEDSEEEPSSEDKMDTMFDDDSTRKKKYKIKKKKKIKSDRKYTLLKTLRILL